MQGTVVKGVGSFYTILDRDGAEYVCKARGRFRKDGISPLPGDRVEFQMEKTGEGRIAEILPRKNLLVRPAVANLDKLFIVMAATSPKPDLLLVDKLLIQCEMLGIAPFLVLNKAEEAEEAFLRELREEYAVYPIFSVSAHTGLGMELLEAALQDSISCFAGQSAVGKSSILNRLLSLSMPTGGLSRKTDRGRHTTRHAELLPAFGGAVLDTPGFSLLDMTRLEPWDLCKYYPEMRAFELDCRFSECVHVHEPDCAVKKRLQEGKIPMGRYERYCLLVEELKEMKKNRYD